MSNLESLLRDLLQDGVVEITTASHCDILNGAIIDPRAVLAVTLTGADALNRVTLRRACVAFRRIKEQRGDGVVILHIDGYDDDPRDLWEIPELCAWLAAWCCKVGIANLADLQAATGMASGNAWVLACLAAHEGVLTPLGDDQYQISTHREK